MKGRLRFVALAFAGLLIPASCASVFGADPATHESVVTDLCSCTELDFLVDCESKLNARFERAGPLDRQAWLDKYDRQCSASCTDVLPCLSERPTCVIQGCTDTRECCQAEGTPKKICGDGGICESH